MSMKKTTLAIVIAFVASFIALWFLLPLETEAPTPAADFVPDEVDAEAIETGVSSLADLANTTRPIECTIQYRPTPNSDEITGSFFVAASNQRGDFVLTDETLGEIVTSFIMTDDTLYVWSLIDGEQYGVKTVTAERNTIASVPVPDNVPVRYSCEGWEAVDVSIFNPPSDVLFRDSSQLQAEFGTIYEAGEF